MDSKLNLLRFSDRVDGIIKGEFKPPVMADVDVVKGLCNLQCDWCAQSSSRESSEPIFMDADTMVRLGEFCEDWGVKSWRIAGNSEPTLNKDLSVLLAAGYFHGIDMGLITNGTHLDGRDLRLTIGALSWLGISLDATDADRWLGYKHSNPALFHHIIRSIQKIRQDCPDLDITIKLVKWDSQKDIGDGKGNNFVDAEELPEFAKSLGCNYVIRNAMPKNPQYTFDVCRATPLYGTFGADKKFYLCCDKRGYHMLTTDYTKRDWSELKILWGTDFHKMLIGLIDPKTCEFCSKERLNTIFESIILDGKETKKLQVNFI